MAEMEVYWGSGSQPSWRVLLALEVKGAAYDSRLIEFSKGDHKKPEFLALNPRHQVPVLKDGDFVMYESVAIIAYLDQKFPDPPLFGATIQETGEIWRRVMEFMGNVDGPLMSIVRPVFFGKVEEHREKIDQNVPRLKSELALLEQAIEGRDYFVGDQVSAVDIVMYPSLRSLVRAGEKPAFESVGDGLLPYADHFPRLAEWMGRMELLPGYDKTFPPHWRE
jgi:glutathione S-transferase